MRKIIILYALLLSIVSCNEIPKEITVPMEVAIGKNPFGHRVWSPRPNQHDTIQFEGIMKDLEKVDLRSIQFQTEQKVKTKNKVHFFVGEKDDQLFIKLDANNNSSFLDDELMIFEKGLSDQEIKEKLDNLPVVNVSYQYVENNELFDLQTSLQVDPYSKRDVVTMVNGKVIDPFENDIHVRFMEYDYRKGQVKINDKEYKIAMRNAQKHKYKGDTIGTKMIIVASEKQFTPTWEGYVPVTLGENFVIDRVKYNFRQVSQFGDSIKLSFVGKESKPVGVNVGELASNFEKTALDGSSFQLSDQKGKYVLMDFWGTWCQPCIASLPKLREVNASYAEKGLVTLSVAYDDDIGMVRKGVAEHQLDWINIFQARKDKDKNTITNLFKVSGFPTLILIDPNGKIVFRLSGFRPEKYSELIAILDKAYS